jgi:indole-3-glycerol phosphate synthase
MSGTFLEKIIEKKREDLERNKLSPCFSFHKKEKSSQIFSDALRKSHLSVIAEIKRASPSKGVISASLDFFGPYRSG